MLLEVLAAAVTKITPADLAQLHYYKEPLAFCDGVWASMIADVNRNTDDTDTIDLNFPDKLSISCPRPYWYAKPPKRITIPSNVSSSYTFSSCMLTGCR